MNNRIYFFYGILLVGFMLLLGRAAELQIIFGARNREIAEGNRIRKIVNPAPRGMIYDRKDRPLVRNVPVYRRCPRAEKECRQISRDEALRIEVRGGQEAEELRVDIGREYVYGPPLSHLLGYLGELNKEEVKAGKGNLGDWSGRTGIEEKYNDILKGTDGGEVFEVNAEGMKVREIGVQQPVSGKDLHLSVDAELSKVAFEALEGRAGAVLATEAKTGAVLVLVSSPSFNPGKITEEVLIDKSRPMFNRAVGGLYPPGSVFKIVTATAGLEERKIDENTPYEDPGEIRVGDYVYKNWYFTQYGKTEGKINIVRAIRRSTDTFFYKLGEWIGASRLAEWAKVFGLGRHTGIDLPTEAEGLVPDPSSGPWFLGNTYHFAIGQANLLTTPLQVNMMTSIIANDGLLCRPVIVYTSGESWLPLPLQPATPEVKKKPITHTSDGGPKGLLRGEINCQDLQLKSETLRLVKEGMKEACLPGGTAFPLFDFSPSVACKTGTAEFGDPAGRTHAWLTAFAPADDPQIVVTALVEAGGEGSYIAAPIVKKVMEVWF